MTELLNSVLPGDEITDLTPLSGGASRQTWRFAAAGRPLVVQVRREGDMAAMNREVATLRAARSAGALVAEVVACSADLAGTSEAFIVMAAIEGEAIARKILRDDQYNAARAVLVGQLGHSLGRLHSVPIDHVPLLEEVDQLDFYRTVFDSFGAPHPAFELAFRWLQSKRPGATRRTVVHGDFRLGNLLVNGDGLAAVLDWELAHLGDPVEDLGWLCVRAWRFGAKEHVAGLGNYGELLDAYEHACGVRVDVDAVHWWEVFGTLKWGIICMQQANAHLSGAIRSHELAAIGRRVCENEYDLFLALDGRW